MVVLFFMLINDYYMSEKISNSATSPNLANSSKINLIKLFSLFCLLQLPISESPVSAQTVCRQIPYRVCYQVSNLRTGRIEIKCEIRYEKICPGNPKT